MQIFFAETERQKVGYIGRFDSRGRRSTCKNDLDRTPLFLGVFEDRLPAGSARSDRFVALLPAVSAGDGDAADLFTRMCRGGVINGYPFGAEA